MLDSLLFMLALILPAVPGYLLWTCLVQRSPRGVAAAASFCLGHGLLSLGIFLVGVCGAGLSFASLVAIFLALASAAAVARCWVRCERVVLETVLVRDSRWLTTGLLVLIGVVFTLIACRAGMESVSSRPGQGIWVLKAKVFYMDKNMRSGFFVDPGYFYTQQSYPLSLPILILWVSTIMGEFNEHLVSLIPLLFLGLICWSLFDIQRLFRVPTPWALVVVLGLLGSHGLYFTTVQVYAENYLLLTAMIGTACLVMGLESERNAAIGLGYLFLGLAGWVKNEGVLLLLVASAIMACLQLLRAGRAAFLSSLLLSLCGAACVPWLIFRATLGITVRDFSRSADHMSNLSAFPTVVWSFLNPAFASLREFNGLWIVATVLYVFGGRRLLRDQAAQFLLLLSLAVTMAFFGAFIFSSINLDYHLRAVPRILLCPLLFAILGAGKLHGATPTGTTLSF